MNYKLPYDCHFSCLTGISLKYELEMLIKKVMPTEFYLTKNSLYGYYKFVKISVSLGINNMSNY